MDRSKGSTPVPDPTTLTTLQLDREIQSLTNLVDEKFNAVNERFTGRIAVVDTRFDSIKTQFLERDTRISDGTSAARESLEAAMSAAKEAVAEQNRSNSAAIAKAESATDRRIEQLEALLHQTTKGYDEKIGDLKDSLARIQTALLTRQAIGANTFSYTQLILGTILGVASVLAILFAKAH